MWNKISKNIKSLRWVNRTVMNKSGKCTTGGILINVKIHLLKVATMVIDLNKNSKLITRCSSLFAPKIK